MAYQGRQPGVGVRNRFIYSATGGQTSFSGADSNGLTLAYSDATYVDVFLNGTLLVPVTDYAATTKTSVVLGSGAAASDIVEIVAYDISSMSGAVNKTGDTMTGNLTVQGTVAATAYTGDGSALTGVGSPSIDDNGNATAITITSDEEVLIGKTTDAQQTVGTTLYQNGQIYSTVNGSHPLVVTRKTNDGALALFYKDTNEVGRIGTPFQEELYIAASGADSAGILLTESNQVRPMRNGSASDATQNLGSGNGRWKDLYLSGGVYLGGTGSANKLEDYEEGTFTPVLDNVSCSYSAQTGSYTKVGNMVTARFEIGVTGLNTGDGSGFQIGGLPFVCGASGVLFTMDTENSNVITNKSNVLGARPIVSASGVRLTDNGGEYAYNNGTSSSGSLIAMVQYFTT